MYDKAVHSFCSEFYTVAKSIEVVVKLRGGPSRIRIDALRSEIEGRFSTKAYIEESLTLQPTYPQTSGSFQRKPEEFRVWVDYDLPWVDSDSADGALRRAVGFLAERVTK